MSALTVEKLRAAINQLSMAEVAPDWVWIPDYLLDSYWETFTLPDGYCTGVGA